MRPRQRLNTSMDNLTILQKKKKSTSLRGPLFHPDSLK